MTWEKGLSRAILVVVSCVYAYGAFLHVSNLAGGYGAPDAPLPVKWVAIDMLYTCLSLLVAGGLVLGARVAVGAFYLAAFWQIMLSAVYREWVLEMPDLYDQTTAPLAYFDQLLPFVLVMIFAVSLALFLRWAR
ncbi:MAG: hypothetical protein AAFQ36_01740 [Pseudomonadota bacterium]